MLHPKVHSPEDLLGADDASKMSAVAQMLKAKGVTSLQGVDAALSGMLGALDWENAQQALANIEEESGPSKRLWVIGGSRMKEGEESYEAIRNLTAQIVRAGIAWIIIQGGCGGTMEAAGKGTMEAGGISVGCVPHDCPIASESGGYDTKGWGVHPYNDHVIRFATYSGRRDWMDETSDAVLMNANLGAGTLDEVTGTFVRNQYPVPGKKPKPLIVFGDTAPARHLEALYASMVDTKALHADESPVRNPDTDGLMHFLSDPDAVITLLRRKLAGSLS